MDAIMGRQRIIPTVNAWFGRSTPGDRRIVLPIAVVAGIAIGGLVALAFLVLPIAVLEDMAVDSGVAALLTAAQPPLGTTARLAVAAFAALAAGGLSGFGLLLVVGARTMPLRHGVAEDGIPVLRRADAHPDAPPRRPVFAHRDLGTPFLEVKAEPIAPPEARPLPSDLDTPLASYRSPRESPLPAAEPLPIARDRDPDPVAAPPIGAFALLAEDQPILPAAPRFAPHERIETFVMPPAAGADPAAPLPQPTIHDLLERLERGVARHDPKPAPLVVQPEPPRESSLEDTLEALRALARRVG